ncbi:inositol monophosphatase family protein [Pseudalkalibacillus caeni]|uniref:inositol-phosphate phosphatase n=1 Tax=Exobacillus caeni TaxID=2574798 RepID=A0A5R9FAW7_9BACL|nr:inositol monophosphatase family protein [Pseudalkalibacillus caeni]TLS37684.1 inositol monophosphatase family protein [Pseudalkalibacillus caeni]
MNEANWEEIYQISKKWVNEAGDYIKETFNTSISVEYKSNPSDLVTDIDRHVEQLFIEKIHTAYPEHRIVGEEGFGDKVKDTSGIIWFVDPIDGTTNFVHQQSNFAISIGIYEEGIGKVAIILDVARGEMFHCLKGQGAFMNDIPLKNLSDVELHESVLAINATWLTENKRVDSRMLAPLVKELRGTRSLGSAAIEMAYIAAGRLDGYISLRLSPWDFAAGAILVEEVGGKCTTLDGRELNMLKQNTVFAGKSNVHQMIHSNFIKKGLENNYFLHSPS